MLRPPLKVYSVVLGSVLLTLLLKWLLEGWLGLQSPFLLFLIPVIGAGWYAGWRGGILATLVAALLSAYFFVPPLGSWGLDREGVLRVLLFLLEGGLISFLVNAFARSEAALGASEQRLRLALEVAKLGTWDWDIVTDTLVWSPVHEQMFGLEPGSFEGSHAAFLARVHPDDRAAVGHAVSAATPAAPTYEGVFRTEWPDRTVRWVSAKGQFFFDEAGKPIRMIGVAHDCTARRQAESTQQLLAQVSDLLASSLDHQGTLATVLRLIVPRFADLCALDLLDADGTLQQVALAHADPAAEGVLRNLRAAHPARLDAAYGAGLVVRTGLPRFLPEVTETTLRTTASSESHLSHLRALAVRSYLCVPLLTRGRVCGALACGLVESGRRYTPSDLVVAEELGRRIALALDNATLYQTEQQTRRAAEQGAQRIGRLQAVTAALSEALTPAQVAEVIIHQGVEAMGADAGTIVQLTEDAQQLELLGAAGYPARALANWGNFSVQAPVPIADTVRRNEPIWIESEAVLQARYPQMLAGPIPPTFTTLVAIPLRVEGRALGAMGLSFRAARTWSDEERGFMLSLARQCAQALERARLYEGAQQARARAEAAQQRLTFLTEVGIALTETLNYETVLETLVRRVVASMADYCILYRLTEEGRLQRAAMAHANPAKQPLLDALQGFPLDAQTDEIVGEVLRRGESRLAPTMETFDLRSPLDEPGHVALLEQLNPRSYLMVPLLVRGRALGVLALVWSESGRQYDAADLSLAEELARRAALAVDNAGLFRDMQAAHGQASTIARNAAFLAESSAILASSLEYESNLGTIARLALPLLGDLCLIDIQESDGVVRRVAAAHVDPGQEPLLQEMARAYPPDPQRPDGTWRAMRTGLPELTPDVTERLAAYAYDTEHLEMLQVLSPRSTMSVPMIARGRVLGALVFAVGHARRLDWADVRLAEELARRIALAVDNARLHREAQEAIQVRDLFFSIASHELKSPITSIKGYSELLQRRMEGKGEGSGLEQRALRVISEETGRLNKLVERLLDVSRIQNRRMEIERYPVDLTELLHRLVGTLQMSHARHTLRLTGPDEPLVVEGDALRLEQVFQNLIDNAVKYSPQGGQVTVALEHEALGARVAITDEGIGIPPPALARLFDHFYRAPNFDARRISGLGLGLYIVRHILDAHGGTICVTSTVGVGSTFTVELPRL